MLVSNQVHPTSARSVLVGCALLGILLLGSCTTESAPPAGPQAGDAIELEGTLIDSRCFPLDDRNAGPDHYRPEPEGFVTACARACAMQGFPVAVLENGDPEGNVWVLMTVPAMLADYMSQQVRISGTVRSAGLLIPDRIETYSSQGEWLTVL